MTPKRAATWLGGSMLLAAWLAAAAAPSFAPVPAVETSDQKVSEPDRQVLMLAAEAERLRQRLNIVAVRRPVTRNLFQFAAKAPHATPVSQEILAPVSIAPIPPAVKLLGVAEDTIDANPRRTAILTVEGELLLVREGETFGARYRLTRLGADVAEIDDTTDTRTFRVALP
ncbi:MAG: hypothetical protein EHM89_14540 [Acidobacteria bacterium]|jgi:hypothetical protein|nr:MAG: hypothetical protein EHM89_14540 [Acidobacteriota bacterium]